jgi:hypothetical protein
MGEGLADALIAARLLARSPGPLGGLCLRGCGPAVDRVLEALAVLLPPGTPLRRLPGHIDEERLCGGTDIAASLAGGMLCGNAACWRKRAAACWWCRWRSACAVTWPGAWRRPWMAGMALRWCCWTMARR